MLFGMYTPVENAGAMAAAGWGFIEENITEFFQGEEPDEKWRGAQRVKFSPLPVLAGNRLLPPHLKPVGSAFDLGKLQKYMSRVIRRSGQVGCKTLVFGSGAARMVPAGFERASAKAQLLEFIRMSVEIAARHGVMIVAEPLNREECNIMNGVAECMEYVREVNSPHFQCLVDSYHVWLDNEPLEPLAEAMPWIKHVHISDVEKRNVPTEESPHDYRKFLGVLKRGGYDGPIAVESPDDPRVLGEPRKILEFVKKLWNES